MLVDFGYIGLFLVVAVLFTVSTLLIPASLRFLKIVPKNPTPVKNSAFECGMETIGKTWVQFNFRYYFYALIFLAIDVLIIFIYPWAVSLRNVGTYGLVAVLIMMAIVIVGYVYAWRQKVLEWK